MKIRSIKDKVAVSHNKEIFALDISKDVEYVINDFSWNEGYLSGSEEVLAYIDLDVYYGEWVDANLLLHVTYRSYDLAKHLYHLLPESLRYFYLITPKFILTLPYSLLKKVSPVDIFPTSKNYRIMN